MKVLRGEEQLTLNYGKQTLNNKPYDHKGIDLVKKWNQLSDILAIDDGVVTAIRTNKRGYDNSYGNFVQLKHKNGYKSFYAHLYEVNVKVGETVKRGQKIGYMGATGYAFGAHLHLEISKDGKRLNPYSFIFGNKNFDIEKPNVDKTISQLAKEVIDGKYGNGAERKEALGSKYDEVQRKVNEILLGNSKKAKEKTISQLADEVMKGLHGNGAERVKSLGSKYDEVQKEVNRRYGII